MALDPAKYFIIVANMLGNGLPSSPSNTPEPYDTHEITGVRAPLVPRSVTDAVPFLISESRHRRHRDRRHCARAGAKSPTRANSVSAA